MHDYKIVGLKIAGWRHSSRTVWEALHFEHIGDLTLTY